MTGTAVNASIPEATVAQTGATISSTFGGGRFSGTLRDPSAIASTKQVSGILTVFHSEGAPRAPVACDGTATFTGTVNWTQIVLVAPTVPLSCGGAFTNVRLSLVRQQ